MLLTADLEKEVGFLFMLFRYGIEEVDNIDKMRRNLCVCKRPFRNSSNIASA